MHRWTHWYDEDGNIVQVAVACLDATWEPHAEVVEAVGPFDAIWDKERDALELAHALGGWRAHQGTLDLV